MLKEQKKKGVVKKKDKIDRIVISKESLFSNAAGVSIFSDLPFLKPLLKSQKSIKENQNGGYFITSVST